MKKCFSKPLALVHKLEHSLTATTFYKIKLIPVHSGVIPVHSGPFRCHSGSFRSIPVSFRFIPVHSGVIPVHSGPFRCHSGSFQSIPPHSGSFRSVSVFSNAPKLNMIWKIMQIEEVVICQSRRLEADNTLRDLHIFFIRNNRRMECSLMTSGSSTYDEKIIL